MVNDPFQIGTQVIIWGRPETNLILLFGEGRYEGVTYVNGNWWPTVRLNNGREITVHQQGIAIGRAEAVGEQCARFKGDVIEWDLDAFLRGDKPTIEQRQHASPNGISAAPPPKTASDRVLYMKEEIRLQKLKIQAAEKVIADAKAIIAAKEKEIIDSSQAVLTEIAAVNPDILKQLAAQVAEQLKAAPSQATTPELTAEDKAVVYKTPVVKPIASAPDPAQVDHEKLATED